MTTNNHTAMVTLRAEPSRRSDLAAALDSVKVELPAVDGCCAVRVLEHADDETSFTLIEDWQSKEQHAAHVDNLVESGAWAQLEMLLREPPVSQSLVAK